MTRIDRVHRLLQLVGLLQSGRVYTSAQLADLCAVSRRTIFRDLKTLQESGIQVLYDENRNGHSLPTSTFLPPTDFTLDESLSLLILCHELGDDEQGIPFQRAARKAALKLLSNLPQHLREYVGELTELVTVRLEARSPMGESKPHYELLMRAMNDRRQVRIRYRSLDEGREITTLVSPYRILFSRRSWYTIGRSSLHREIRTFNIGRILETEILDSTYKIPQRFSLERYLGNAWHLIRDPENSYDVVVRFRKQVAYNVAEVRWHKTQEIVWNDDGTLDFRATVDGLDEIKWWILGYGEQAEVLEPPELRERITEHIRGMHAQYLKNGETADAETASDKPESAAAKQTRKTPAKKTQKAAKPQPVRKKRSANGGK